MLGLEHPDTFAVIYWSQGRWNEAKELQVLAMEIKKKVLGLEHPDTLWSIRSTRGDICGRDFYILYVGPDWNRLPGITKYCWSL